MSENTTSTTKQTWLDKALTVVENVCNKLPDPVILFCWLFLITAIIGCIFHGIFIMILPALLSPMLAQIGFVNMTCTDVDTVVTGFFFMAIKSILSVFGIA